MGELDLSWALSRFQQSWRRQRYDVYTSYYEGDHPLAFASQKFKEAFAGVFKEFAENACPPVVDALNERLQITGFRSNNAEVVKEDVPASVEGVPPRTKATVEDAVGQEAWNIWRRNRMDLRSTETHLEALKSGDGYVLVWPDENMEAAIWPQKTMEFDVQYDPNTLGKILRACKLWLDDVERKWRLNIYLPNRIEKYVSNTAAAPNTPLPTKPEQWSNFLGDGVVPNPYGRVPAFHFPNKLENQYGVSELKDVIPLQNGLNKAVMDMLVAMEFASFKQRYIIGMEVDIDPDTGQPTEASARNYGVDRLMAIPDPEAKVGQFDATDLGQFIEVQEKFWLSVARVTGTPLHYFYITSGDFPSGEAIKSAEGRFIKRINDRQTSYGNQWEDVVKFAMHIDGKGSDDLELSAMWKDATPRSDSEIADTGVKKKAIGVPASQLMREMGYSEEEIDMFLEEADAQMMQKHVLDMQTAQAPKVGEEGTPPAPSRDTTRARQGVPGGNR